MKEKFKRWSEIKPEAKQNIDPKLGLRNWHKLSDPDKKNIWNHFNLRKIFLLGERDSNGELVNENDSFCIIGSVHLLTIFNKKKAFAKNFLMTKKPISCFADFESIFFHEKEDVVLELISFYCQKLCNIREEEKIRRNTDETETDYQKRLLKWRLKPFDDFKFVFNDIFEQFELNYRLTRGGIMPYQPKKIIEEIYEPVLESLCDEKFKKVNRDLEDAIKHFRKKEKNAYSTCISLCIAGVEEFLKILILDGDNKVNSDVLSKLIDEAQRKKVIPNDFFSKQIFSNLKSILMRDRQEKSQAHSKDNYATEKNAKLMLNLTMVFMQHCIEC